MLHTFSKNPIFYDFFSETKLFRETLGKGLLYFVGVVFHPAWYFFCPAQKTKKIKNHNSESEENVPLLNMRKDFEEDGNDDF